MDLLIGLYQLQRLFTVHGPSQSNGCQRSRCRVTASADLSVGATNGDMWLKYWSIPFKINGEGEVLRDVTKQVASISG